MAKQETSSFNVNNQGHTAIWILELKGVSHALQVMKLVLNCPYLM